MRGGDSSSLYETLFSEEGCFILGFGFGNADCGIITKEER
jgi:hypothetical protein